MSRSRVRLILFIALAVVQLAAAAGAIIRAEVALRSGEIFRFRLQPVDPVVALRFVEDRAAVPAGLPQLNRRKIYVPLRLDDEGFATFGEVALDAPAEGAYLRLRSGPDFTDENGDRRVSLTLPFRRYYMTEELARGVDRRLWRRGQRPAWVTVRVRAGVGVIDDLWIDGVPARDWQASNQPEQPPAPQP
jgi:hypothetical protein